MKENASKGGKIVESDRLPQEGLDRGRRAALKKVGIAAAAAFGAPMVLPSRLLAQKTAKADTPPPSERLSIGMIGIGTAMENHRRSMATNKELFLHAACDVDMRRVQAFQVSAQRNYRTDIVKYGKCFGTQDYREIIERDDIDGVVISTPTHWQGKIALDAIRSGKDVLVQSPMTLTVHEGKLIEDAAMQHGAMVQCVAAQRCEASVIKLCELVRNGYLGDITEIHVDLKYFKEAEIVMKQRVPKELDFDRWLGPAPSAEYHSAKVSGSRNAGWRSYWDYSLGAHGEQGFPYYDMIQWALGTEDTGPVEFIPAGSGGSAFSSYRYESGATVLVGHPVYEKQGIGFVGTLGDAAMKVRGSIKSSNDEISRTKITSGDTQLRADTTPELAWIESVKTRQKPNLDAATAHRSSTVAQLISIAERIGRPIKWDPKKQVILEDESASRLLTRPRRSPYTLV